MKLLIIPVVAIIIVALVAYVVLQVAKRVKPVPPNRELEEARRLLTEVSVREELLPSLPERTMVEISRFLNNKENS